RQVHVHVEVRHRVLLSRGPVLDPDGMIDVLDADLVDRQLPGVGMTLYVLHGRDTGLFGGDRDVHRDWFPAAANMPEMGLVSRIAMISEGAKLPDQRPSGAVRRSGGG